MTPPCIPPELMRANSPCFLPALGLVNVLGNNPKEVASRLLAGDSTGIWAEEGWLPGKTALLGKVHSPLPQVPKAFPQYASRCHRLLLAAYMQIEQAVCEALERYGKSRVGIVLGTSNSGIAEGESAIEAHRRSGRLPEGYHYSQQELGAPALFLAGYLGLGGPAYVVSTACTSSAKALVSARSLLEHGLCDAVITGGVDALCKLTVNGFEALELLSSSLCNPMSRHRNGINIGEGAALFLMTRENLPGGAEVLFYGAGESSDAYHMSAPHPEGLGAQLALQAALEDAGFPAKEVDYLNMHATATPKNDATESLAIHRLFPEGLCVSGTKPMTGHLLGAAGATEVGLCWLALQEGEGLLPPHLWDGEEDAQLPKLNLVKKGDTFARKTNRLCLSSSFAFGGNNACLLIGDAR